MSRGKVRFDKGRGEGFIKRDEVQGIDKNVTSEKLVALCVVGFISGLTRAHTSRNYFIMC